MVMKINHSKNTFQFASRNIVIRKADDIARTVNREFPRVSLSRINSYRNEPSAYLLYKYKDKLQKMRNYKGAKFNNAKSPLEKLLAFFIPISERKIGNCAESAQMTMILAKLNGIENCSMARLKTLDGFSLDHQVVIVNDKNPYVIDSWLGFADYLPNILDKYKGEYRRCFKITRNNEKGINFVQDSVTQYDSFLKKPIDEKTKKELLELYPKFLIK